MFVDNGINTAEYNMDYDFQLLQKCENENIDFALRLYKWDRPSVSLGRNQRISGIDEQFCKDMNIPVVRRITGGRALLHDDELTYCVVCNKKIMKNGANIIADYKQISDVLISALNNIGIKAYYGDKTKSNIGAGYCMNLSTICDVSVNNKKFIGSAQFRQNTHILQHGAIPYSFNTELLDKIFMGKVDFEHITSISELTDDFDEEKFKKELYNCFKEEFGENFNND